MPGRTPNKRRGAAPSGAPARDGAKRTHDRLGRLAAQRGLEDFLGALGVSMRGELRHAPARAVRLWQTRLLKGQGVDLKLALGRGQPTQIESAVTLFHLGVHLVCPHHLTVAFGKAHVAYLPGGRLAGFGALSRLVEAATARLVLQEQASQDIADTLVEHLAAVAATVVIEAVHPCHNLVHQRSHAAEVVTWATSGSKSGARELKGLLARGMAGKR